jgi:hypothetical protein
MFVDVRAMGKGAAQQSFIPKGDPQSFLQIGESGHDAPAGKRGQANGRKSFA